eukprot:TRINITY_DN58099_c0_g1_i1.p1 TRINITY_DN58099_c0_g1~~TRINITY_DN58099_c0_g1_i1.p1  ORF type:complete len:126 (+),score=11.45 TRINITY_DN58099_c0_g1_i1:312-689(+)
MAKLLHSCRTLHTCYSDVRCSASVRSICATLCLVLWNLDGGICHHPYFTPDKLNMGICSTGMCITLTCNYRDCGTCRFALSAQRHDDDQNLLTEWAQFIFGSLVESVHGMAWIMVADDDPLQDPD